MVGLMLAVTASATDARSGAQTTHFTDGADPRNALDARAARLTTSRTETRIVIDFTSNTANPVDSFGPLRVSFSQAQTARGPGVREVVVANALAGRVTAEVRDGTAQRVASATARLGARRVVVKVPTAHLRRATRHGKTWFRAHLTSFSGVPPRAGPGEPPAPADAPRTGDVPDVGRQLTLR